MQFVESFGMFGHLMSNRMIGNDSAIRGRDDQVAIRAGTDTANKTGKLPVEEHTHPASRAVETDRRDADSVAGIEHAVATEGDSSRTTEARLNEWTLASVRQYLGNAAVGEM